jgi:hypothetical protein
MPRRPGPPEHGSRFTPLVAFIEAQQGDHVTLTFTEIEAIIGAPLSISAQVTNTLWSSPQLRHVRDLAAVGWRAHLRVRAHAVEFRRIVPGT